MKIGETISLCQDSLRAVNADIIEENHKIFMLKECGEKILLDNDAEIYKKMPFQVNYGIKEGDDIDVVWDKIRGKVYSTVIYITAKCNQSCKICYRNFVHDTPELNILEVEDILKKNNATHISFSGGECTTREDLPDMIRLAKKYKRKVWIITNGVRIANKKYLQGLLDAGLDGVHLSFDGFREDIYQEFRGYNLLKTKLLALKNLKELHVPVELIAVIDKDFNPEQVNAILEYSKANGFVKFVRFMPLYEQIPRTTESDILKLVAKATGKSTDYFINQMRIFSRIHIGKLKISDFFIFRGLQRPLSVFVCGIQSPINMDLQKSMIFSESKGTPISKDGRFSIQLMVGKLD